MLLDIIGILFMLLFPPLACVCLDMYAFSHNAADEDGAGDTAGRNMNDADGLESARACLAIIEMTPTNNDAPPFGKHFFEELEEGLALLSCKES